MAAFLPLPSPFLRRSKEEEGNGCFISSLLRRSEIRLPKRGIDGCGDSGGRGLERLEEESMGSFLIWSPENGLMKERVGVGAGCGGGGHFMKLSYEKSIGSILMGGDGVRAGGGGGGGGGLMTSCGCSEKTILPCRSELLSQVRI